MKIIGDPIVEVYQINYPNFQVLPIDNSIADILFQLTMYLLKLMEAKHRSANKQEDVTKEDFSAKDSIDVVDPIWQFYCSDPSNWWSGAFTISDDDDSASYFWRIQSRWSEATEDPHPFWPPSPRLLI